MAPPEPQLPPPAERATMEDSCHHAAAADAMDDAAADAPGDAAASAMDPRPSPAYGTVHAARTAEAARTTRNTVGEERQHPPG